LFISLSIQSGNFWIHPRTLNPHFQLCLVFYLGDDIFKYSYERLRFEGRWFQKWTGCCVEVYEKQK